MICNLTKPKVSRPEIESAFTSNTVDISRQLATSLSPKLCPSAIGSSGILAKLESFSVIKVKNISPLTCLLIAAETAKYRGPVFCTTGISAEVKATSFNSKAATPLYDSSVREWNPSQPGTSTAVDGKLAGSSSPGKISKLELATRLVPSPGLVLINLVQPSCFGSHSWSIIF